MNRCLYGVGVVSLGLLLTGGGWADPPARTEDRPAVKPSTERTLRLPETPFRYAEIDLPAHNP